jgi:5'/3'-nucleotidase
VTRPLVLLSNDDGYRAAGLAALRSEIERFADVVVCAPHANQSATSHSLTLQRILRLGAVDERTFVLDGTPADCIYVALHAGERVLPRRPDLVVSGMNEGPNLAVDVMYSGTVAAAREAAQRGIPAVAVSADRAADRAAAAALGAAVVAALWRRVAAEPPAHAPLLNVNIPPGSGWELRPTRIGRRLYEDEVIFRKDPRQHEYLWIGGVNVSHDLTAGTDTWAWEEGAASVTPLALDLTDAGCHALTAAVAADALQRPGPA